MRDAVFTIRLNDAGTVAGFRTFDQASAETVLNEMTQWAEDNLLVGVSTHQTDNRKLSSINKDRQDDTSTSWQDADISFFVGTQGTEHFVAGPLRSQKTVQLPKVAHR